MQCMPIGKRTRLQKALKTEEFREKSYVTKDLRKKRDQSNGGTLVANSGFISSGDDDDDDDGEECSVIDETEFLKSKFEKNSPQKKVGIQKIISEVGSFVDDDHGENSLGSEDNGNISMNDDGNHGIHIDVDDSDDDDGGDGEKYMGLEDNGNISMNDDGNHGIHIDVDDRDDDDGGGGGEKYMGLEDNDITIMKDDGSNDVHMDDDDADVNVDDDDVGDGDDDDGDGKRRGDVNNAEFHMRKFEGMILPTNPEKNNADDIFIGKRTRSHYKPKYPRKKHKDGTISCPITIDVEESASSHDDKGDYEPKKYYHDEKSCVDDGGKRKRGRPPLNKDDHMEFKGLSHRMPRVKRVKTNEVQSDLLNAILNNGNEGLQDLMSSCVSEGYLPLKFKFGGENLVPQYSEDEQESEYLFKEMESALIEEASCQKDKHEDETVVTYDSAIVHEKLCDEGKQDSAILHDKLCNEGKHYWIHDDEIGIKCKFCSFVKLEIRHVMPDFNEDPFGIREENRYYGQYPYDDHINVDSDKIQFPDLSYGCRGEPDISVDTPGTVWDLIPGTKRTLYPHQRDGFEFIWRNIAGGIRMHELGKPSTKFGLGGCIICHAPGTGKTRLAIVFLQSFMKQYPMSKPVIVAPYSMLRTWEEEFARWNVNIPLFNLNEKELSGKEDPQLVKLYTRRVKDEKTVRMTKLATWALGKGVLGISYRLFQWLAGNGVGVDEKVREVLLKQPGILVLDEGHTPRNEKSKICEVLSEVATKRRVILSGTPFQNNFEELRTTIGLVREEFETFPSCSYNLNENRRIEQLKKQIKPFVHVYKGEILRDTLPGLLHYLIVLRPSDLQKRFFARLAALSSKFIKFDNLISVTSVHPSIFCDQKEKPEFLADEEYKALLTHKTNIDAGVKTRFLVDLIKLCKGERILVFGQYLPPLNFIGELLKHLFQWSKGRELLYIDGNQDMKERQSSIKFFNDPRSEARVLLASTKACCEGISLVGASRVVLLDVVWNPSVERQAISRAYRLGQQKNVFVYHLITSGTLEEEKYRRQASKDRLADLLFFSSSSEAGTTHLKSMGSRVVISEDHVLQAMTHHDKTKNIFVKTVCQPKADDLINSFGPMNL